MKRIRVVAGAIPVVRGKKGNTPSHPPLGQRLPRGKKLPSYGVEYFNQLVAQYLTLPPPVPGSPEDNRRAREVAAAVIRVQEKSSRRRWGTWPSPSTPLNWGDLSAMEMALLRLLPGEYLARLAWNLRARYRDIAGDEWADLYTKSDPPAAPVEPTVPQEKVGSLLSAAVKPLVLLAPLAPETGGGADAAAMASLRADMEVLLAELQRLRSVILAREIQRQGVTVWGAATTLLFLAFALLIFFTVPDGVSKSQTITPSGTPPPRVAGVPTQPLARVTVPDTQLAKGKPKAAIMAPLPATSARPADLPDTPRTILLVIAAGALGGLISMLHRVQSTTTTRTTLQDNIELNTGQGGLFLSPMYGAVFAVLLYLVFLGAMATLTVGTAGLFPIFDEDGMLTSWAGFGKLLVWSFVAGFAEKFVPDVLDRLTAQGKATSMTLTTKRVAEK